MSSLVLIIEANFTSLKLTFLVSNKATGTFPGNLNSTTGTEELIQCVYRVSGYYL